MPKEKASITSTPCSGSLVLPLRRKWFEAIREGRKPFEFRLRNDFWRKRLIGKSYQNVIFTLGYPKKGDSSRRIVAPYRGYIETTVVSEEWDNIPQEVFAILTPCHP